MSEYSSHILFLVLNLPYRVSMLDWVWSDMVGLKSGLCPTLNMVV